ncbi:MAG TPA: HAMP domain-containing protein [Nitrospirae bacterium]|nr:HAMP domain-containing protein [Nitrospirota bacterium]
MKKNPLNYIFHSLTWKLIFTIGSMMVVWGVLFTYLFIVNNPIVKTAEVLLYGVSFVIVISVALGLILYNFVTKPIGELVKAMERLAQGDMNYRIKLSNKDEIGILASSFNSMSEELRIYKEKMENWTKELEQEVEKKAAETIRAQEQLLNAEKLASLGRMVASVVHEMNSPLTGIITFSHMMLNRMPEDRNEDIEDLKIIISQAERCSKIVSGLLGFSRKTVFEMKKININSLIENTLMIIKNQMKFQDIEFILMLDKNLPEITVDPNQIQQVFMNLLINASDAMNNKGKITINTSKTNLDNHDYIEILFKDTGPGIPDEIKGRIFEPFFTTKPAGKGTGLGLSVSFGIIKKHKGKIELLNELGYGAIFRITIPIGDFLIEEGH